jgi:hypothetical protein
VEVTPPFFLKNALQMKNNIIHYCNIKNNEVYLDGKKLYTGAEEDFLSFIKGVYKSFGLDYPKFYKMDTLCKLAIASSSILLNGINKEIDPNMAILLSNRSACIDVDIKHQESISQGEGSYASPANFVYTLPNIALGEISIKYKLRSENSFFIFEGFNPEFLIEYGNSLTQLGKSSSVLCGWVEVIENEYNAFMFIIKPEKGIELTKENLEKLI